MTAPQPLDLGLTMKEIQEIHELHVNAEWGAEDTFAQAVGDAATAKAALFFRNGKDAGDCWCPEPEGEHTPWPDAGHSMRCIAVQEFLEAAGIQKPE